MAQKRMFCKDITSSDTFTEMPLSAQALYFHLGLAADVKGFVTPKGTMRLINANQDDLRTLIAKQFVIPFESGVVVITHWNMHNNIREDRESKTIYQEELKQLEEQGGEYQLLDNSGSTPAQIRLGEISLGKINLSLMGEKEFNEFWEHYPRKIAKADAKRAFLKIKKVNLPAILKAIDLQLKSDQWQREGGRFIPYPATWLNGQRWNDEVKEKEPEGIKF